MQHQKRPRISAIGKSKKVLQGGNHMKERYLKKRKHRPNTTGLAEVLNMSDYKFTQYLNQKDFNQYLAELNSEQLLIETKLLIEKLRCSPLGRQELDLGKSILREFTKRIGDEGPTKMSVSLVELYSELEEKSSRMS